LICGFGHLALSDDGPNKGEVRGLYLAPEAVGHGFGKKILELMEVEAKARGTKTLHLGATRTAAAFYRSRGFAPTGAESKMPINGCDIPYIPMAKDL